MAVTNGCRGEVFGAADIKREIPALIAFGANSKFLIAKSSNHHIPKSSHLQIITSSNP